MVGMHSPGLTTSHPMGLRGVSAETAFITLVNEKNFFPTVIFGCDQLIYYSWGTGAEGGETMEEDEKSSDNVVLVFGGF